MISVEQLTKLATALGGLPVLACRPGSPAARAGIQYGDVLLAVNGVRTPDWSAYVEARAKDAAGMQVAIFRGGEELTFDLELETKPGDPASWLAYLSGTEESE